MKDWFLKYQKYLIGIGFILLIAFGVYRNSFEEYELNNHGKITEAKIIDFRYGSNSSYTLKYVFYVNKKKYEDSRRFSFFECDNGKNGCVGQKFKVIYSYRNPKINEINLGKYNKYKLISPSIDFRQFE